jgi:ribosomal protein S18 acetylase RimI-like enzyme
MKKIPTLLLKRLLILWNKKYNPIMEKDNITIINSSDINFPNYQESLFDCMVACWLRKDKNQASKDVLEELGKWEMYFLAVNKDNNLLWFVSWWTRNIQDRRWEFELFHIGANPEIRSRWTGKQLLETLVDFAKNEYQNKWYKLRKFYLYTNIKNTNAHRFYNKAWMQWVWFSTGKFKNNSIEIEYALFFDEDGNRIMATKNNELELVLEITKRLLWTD